MEAKQQHCQVQGHENQELVAICLKQNCEYKNILLCSLCRTGQHKQHSKYQLLLKEIQSNENIPFWPRDNEEVCNKAKDLIIQKQQHNIDKKIDDLFNSFQKKLIEELQSAKERVKSQIGSCGQLWDDFISSFNKVFVISQLQELVNQYKKNELSQDKLISQVNNLLDNESRYQKLEELNQECQQLEQLNSMLTHQKLAELMSDSMTNIFSKENEQEVKEGENLQISNYQEENKSLEKQNENNETTLQQEEALMNLENLKLLKKLSHKSPSLKYAEIRVAIIGNKSVGKTSIINQLISKIFQESINSTNQIELQTAQFKANDQNIFLQLYDVPSNVFKENGNLEDPEQQFEQLTKKLDCIMVVYDSSNQQSFIDSDNIISNFLESKLKNSNAQDFPVFIVGNKSDLESNIPEKTIQDYLSLHTSFKHFKCSAKNYQQILKIFEEVEKKILSIQTQLQN